MLGFGLGSKLRPLNILGLWLGQSLLSQSSVIWS